ncbi:MAG: HesA/MoeB/ThiF family protein [Candidatus Woesearchaeota archaeon]
MSGSSPLIDTEKLKGRKVAVVGVGGLGCTASMLLARQGVDLLLIDGDIVEENNLERQILFIHDDVGRPKVDAAADKISGFSDIRKIFETLTEKNIDMLSGADIVLDCTDNMETRLIIDNFCSEMRIPWIYSAAVKEIGALYFIDPSDAKRARFKDFNEGKEGESTCEVGVMNTTVSIIGAMSAKLVVDFLVRGQYPDKFVRVDLSGMDITRLGVDKR